MLLQAPYDSLNARSGRNSICPQFHGWCLQCACIGLTVPSCSIQGSNWVVASQPPLIKPLVMTWDLPVYNPSLAWLFQYANKKVKTLRFSEDSFNSQGQWMSIQRPVLYRSGRCFLQCMSPIVWGKSRVYNVLERKTNKQTNLSPTVLNSVLGGCELNWQDVNMERGTISKDNGIFMCTWSYAAKDVSSKEQLDSGP